MTTSSDRCLFCRIASGDINARKVYEDDKIIAFEDINPQSPTHVLVIPRRHIATLDDLTETDTMLMGELVRRASSIARDQHINNDGYRLVVNCGEAAGQTVFHLHVHLLGGRTLGWPPG